ncbi:hypothetical protein I204_05148 [Kwoniella mangroviensis CBS 8886]|uniref:uncharacterized protein n=1 Tax=Kwoniella mangroviensis CBS 8507 TaxID=1296122 RepID=UPI00080D4A79|nr:uncharacterized protein I203_00802 [Kwoniella mangroviensis CBS 8507]OCF70667.1 hypothetical protein I203_00802 [Kwoniella mangroviensis CBS 8507]OCF74766.1 hypothetical protein I204_05148 [Kwoniella mangroviensis CBS 8886]
MSFVTARPGSNCYSQLSMVQAVPHELDVVHSEPVSDTEGYPVVDENGEEVVDDQWHRDLYIHVREFSPMEDINVTTAWEATPKQQDDLRFSTYAQTQGDRWHRIWKGLYGETVDDDLRGCHTKNFVPAESYKAALNITTATTSCHRPLSDTQWETTMAGDLQLDQATHAELIAQGDQSRIFRYTLNTSTADLNFRPGQITDPDYDFKDRYLRNENQPREFQFQCGHAMIQPIDGSSIGFKSTSDNYQGGLPPRRTLAGTPWAGEVETSHLKP